MHEKDSERNIESEINSKEFEVSEYENNISEIDEKLESIEQTINNISDDQSLQQLLETNVKSREMEKTIEQQKAEFLKEELFVLLEKINEIDNTNKESGQILDSLEIIGEDILEAEGIVHERDIWVAETQRKVAELIQRLGGNALSNFLTVNTTSGTAQNSPLITTKQTYTKDIIHGKNVLVFDHPYDSAKNAVFNQGTTYPEKFLGTCGCCCSATIMRKAGFDIDEKKVIDYASSNKDEYGDYLCECNSDDPRKNGTTDYYSRAKIIKGLTGLDTHALVTNLEEVTKFVENGHGVIIAVNACLYAPELFGAYVPGKPNGHALVLESVVRDSSTNNVLGYYIIEPNGKTPDNACRYVDAVQLNDAFIDHGSRANITDKVIW